MNLVNSFFKRKEIRDVSLLCIKKGPSEMFVQSDEYAGEYQIDNYSPSEYDDKVIVHGDLYKDENLFKHPRYSSYTTDSNKLLSVIKISTPNGKSIYRAYLGKKGVKGFYKNMVALSPNSIRLLTEKDGKEDPKTIDSVIISRGSKFMYFWNHPYHATRISMRLGVWSIVLAVSGILISCISCIIK